MASSELKKTLNRTEHRPYPLPKGAWVLRMRWLDLLFMHWPVPEASLRLLVPPALKLDTFDGSAWLGITPFRYLTSTPRCPLESPAGRYATGAYAPTRARCPPGLRPPTALWENPSGRAPERWSTSSPSATACTAQTSGAAASGAVTFIICLGLYRRPKPNSKSFR